MKSEPEQLINWLVHVQRYIKQVDPSKIVRELIQLFFDVQGQHADAIAEEDDEAAEYWQGKKDGLRTALTLLDPNNKNWALANEVSLNNRKTELEELRAVCKEAESLLYSITGGQQISDGRRTLSYTPRISAQRVDKLRRMIEAIT